MQSKRNSTDEHWVSISYTNRSQSLHAFRLFTDAQEFCRNSISYSGGRVKRVEITDLSGKSRRTVYDIDWDHNHDH